MISWIDGEPDITPDDPDSWARELGRALALAQARAHDRLAALPSALDGTGSRAEMAGPLAGEVHACWSQIAASPEALNHGDYWSGNVLWRDRALVGIVDWSGAARGPAGFDLGWCRLDLVLLFDERLADVFTRAYDSAGGHDVGDVGLWDRWAAARSHEIVDTWAPNYAPLGRADLDAQELRRRHAAWTSHLLERV